MAKREVNYFTKITSDEDLDKFLLHKALIILDVYQDIFGPCSTSLHGTLALAKVSLMDSDRLQLAVCDAGKIEKLKRFRGKSVPIIVFCDEGKVTEIVYGANIPLLTRTIKTQLEVREGAAERLFYDFDEPLPFEKIELDRIKAEKDESDRIQREKYEAEVFAQLDEVITLMWERANDMGVTLFMPHVADVALKKTLDTARFLMMIPRARKPVQITSELLLTLSYKLENPLDDTIIDYVYGKDLLAVLWASDPRKDPADIMNQFVKEVSELMPVHKDEGAEDNENQERISVEVLERMLDPLIVYLDGEEVAPKRETHRASPSLFLTQTIKPQRQSGSSVEKENQEAKEAAEISTPRTSGGSQRKMTIVDDDRAKLVIPPVWTPANQEGNFMLMYTFFRNQFDHFLPPVAEPEPLHICMIFPVSNRVEIFNFIEEHKKEILAYGFFTSDDFDSCSLICKTPQKYEELPENDSDRIIMKVARRTSSMELALSDMSPLYVSQNTIKGAQECSLVFNESFDEVQDVLTKKPEETKPKRATRRTTAFHGSRPSSAPRHR